MSGSSGDPPFVMNAPIFFDISSSTLRGLLGKQTFCGTHSCADKQVICGQVCISLSVGVLVVTPSIVNLEENGSTKLWSSFARKIGAYAKGLSWTVIPYARSWLGFTIVWSMVSPIYIALLRIRIVVSPLSVLFYAVSTRTIVTAFMVLYASLYGATSHTLP